MLNTTYATVNDLKECTPISQNVADVSQLETWINVAETMYISPILGTALDTQLKNEIEAASLSGNNQTLVNYIIQASIWWTFFEYAPFARTKFVNKGVVQNYADNSQVAPIDDFKNIRQAILDKATFFNNRLIDYLQANATLYPLWRSGNECGGIEKDFSGGIYL